MIAIIFAVLELIVIVGLSVGLYFTARKAKANAVTDNRLKFDERCIYDTLRRVEKIERFVSQSNQETEKKELKVYIPNKRKVN